MPQPYQYSGQTHTIRYPLPLDKADQVRVEEQGMRYRVLTGTWLDDALWREATFFDASLRDAMPLPELSRNPALSITRQIASVYDEPPRVSAEGVDPEDITAILPDTLWPLSERRHFYTEGINESAMRVDWQTDEETAEGMEKTGKLVYRVIPPHLIMTARASDTDPTQPIYIEELRWSVDAWVIEIWDLTGKEPRHAERVLDEDGNVTADQEKEWPDYLLDNDGPFIPYVLWHKNVGHELWAPYEGREVYWGTLTTASLWTFWLFGVRDGSYPQRYTVDLDVEGATAKKTQNGQAVEGLVTNPMTIVRFKSKGDGTGQASQFESAMDVHSTGQAIEQFMAGLAIHAGLSASDVTIGSSNKSGYSIVVSREGQRKARRRQGAPAMMGDRLLLSKAARIVNLRASGNLPTDPQAYVIKYARVAESPAEVKARIDALTAQLEAGLISPVDAYRELHPGTSTEEALESLLAIAESQALLAAASLPATDVSTQIDILEKVRAFLTDRQYVRKLIQIGVIPYNATEEGDGDLEVFISSHLAELSRLAEQNSSHEE